MLKNYHTHTFRCKHANGDVDDYCNAALQQDIVMLGISDHTPLPDDRWLFRRMQYDQLDQYIRAINEAKLKYPDLMVLKSMECDYLPEYETYFEDELLAKHECDYLIGSVHWFPTSDGWIEVPDGHLEKNHLKAYCNHYISAMSCQSFLFMAHPDIFGSFYPQWDSETESCSRAIIEAAVDADVILEINSRGLRKSRIKTSDGLLTKYPVFKFWELAAEYPIKVVINSDAHQPESVSAGLTECYEMARHFDLEIVDFKFQGNGQKLEITSIST